VLCVLPALAAEVPLDFRVEPPAAEVWVMREEGYSFLGRAEGRLFLSVDERDLGHDPAVFRIFYRRPWDSAGKVPPRALSVILMPTSQGLHWPTEGVCTLGWEDRFLASPRLQAGVLLGCAGLAAGFWLAARRRRRLQVRTQLLEAASAVGSALDREQLLAYTRNTVRRAVPHEAGLVVEIDKRTSLLAAWGPAVMLEGPLEDLCRAVLAAHEPRRYPDLSATIYAPPGCALRSLIAVPMERVGVVVLLADRPFKSADVDMLELLAFQIGQALESYRQQQARRNVAVGQLAAGVAHELNTPLGAILLSVESAMSLVQRSPDKAGKRLERAASSVQTAHRIVSGLLCYSRRTLARRLPVNPRQEVEEALSRVTSPVTAQLADVPMIEGDPGQLAEAVYQLVSNATLAESQTVTVRLWADTVLHIEVADDGAGIAEENQERIFEPFFTTRPVGSGTGLGLAVAWRVAELHGGELQLVRSAPGKGSVFELTLPLPEES